MFSGKLKKRMDVGDPRWRGNPFRRGNPPVHIISSMVTPFIMLT